MPRDRQETGRAVHLTAEESRGGEIALRTPVRRAIFIGGLVLIVIVALIGQWLR